MLPAILQSLAIAGVLLLTAQAEALTVCEASWDQNYEGCEVINGDVGIWERTKEGLYRTVIRVNGDVSISGIGERSLDDLANLEFISGNLEITFGDLPESDFFPSLQTVEGKIRVSLLDKHSASLIGFNELTHAGAIHISYNDSLVAIDGFANLVSLGQADVPGDLEIRGNSNLATIRGFDSLSQLSGDLTVADLAKLQSLDAFSNLRRVSGNLTIDSMPDLRYISGFPNLKVVNEHVRMSNEPGFLFMDKIAAITGPWGEHYTRLRD